MVLHNRLNDSEDVLFLNVEDKTEPCDGNDYQDVQNDEDEGQDNPNDPVKNDQDVIQEVPEFIKKCEELLETMKKNYNEQKKDVNKLMKMYNKEFKKKGKVATKKPRKTGFNTLQPVPKKLIKLIGLEEGAKMKRPEVSKRIWEVLEDRGLIYEGDKRVLRADKEIREVFNLSEDVNNNTDAKNPNGFTMYNLPKHIANCYRKK